MEKIWVVHGQYNMSDSWSCWYFKSLEGAERKMKEMEARKLEAIKTDRDMEDVFYHIDEIELQD